MSNEYNSGYTIFASTFVTPKACDDPEVPRSNISILSIKENILVWKRGRKGQE